MFTAPFVQEVPDRTERVASACKCIFHPWRYEPLTAFEGTLAEKAKEKDVYTHLLSVVSNGTDETQLAELLKTGKLKSFIAGRNRFEELPKAHQQMENGKKNGKIVVAVG